MREQQEQSRPAGEPVEAGPPRYRVVHDQTYATYEEADAERRRRGGPPVKASERRVRQVARRAADRVEGGWCRSSYMRLIAGEPHYCTVGAIEASARDVDTMGEVQRRALAIINEESDHQFGGLLGWNDRPERRREQVVRVLRRVAAGEGALRFLPRAADDLGGVLDVEGGKHLR